MVPGRRPNLRDPKTKPTGHAILPGLRQWTTSVNIKRLVTGYTSTLAHNTPSPSPRKPLIFFSVFPNFIKHLKVQIQVERGKTSADTNLHLNCFQRNLPSLWMIHHKMQMLVCWSTAVSFIKRLLPEVTTRTASRPEWADFLCNQWLHRLLSLHKHYLALGCCFDGWSPVLVCFPRQTGHNDWGLNVQQTRF